MNPAQQPVPSPRQVVRILAAHRWRWLVPTAVLGAAAIAYALVRPATWQAWQALIVRNDAVNNQTGPGKFTHTDEMKTVQETILELVKSRGVLTAALERVGPPTGHESEYQDDRGAWPTAHHVAALRDRVELAPPNGAEFGKTEVFYLQVSDHDRPRAIALSGAICDGLLARFQRLRDAKAQSMIDELLKTVHLARADLDRSTAKLTAIEKRVGSDLAELRALDDAGSGESTLRRTIVEVRSELRQIATAREANSHLLGLLEQAQEDPGRLAAMPNRLLESQPALRRLKDGLVDAQLSTAALLGTRTDEHPLVRAARESEEEVGRHLHNELAIAVRGVRLELQLDEDRQAMLRTRLQEATRRLDFLAGLRATYANQVAETDSRTALLQQAQQDLAEARATHAGAQAASLISRIDSPEAGIYPAGAGRSTIAMIGILGGLLVGLAIVLLTAESSQPAAAPVADRRQPQPHPPTPARPSVSRSIAAAMSPGGGLSFREVPQEIDYVSKV